MKINPTTITDLLSYLQPEDRDMILQYAAESGSFTGLLRNTIYSAVDRIPARWGKFGAFCFRLFAAPGLKRFVDRELDRLGGNVWEVLK
jgi:hypothetical protein